MELPHCLNSSETAQLYFSDAFFLPCKVPRCSFLRKIKQTCRGQWQTLTQMTKLEMVVLVVPSSDNLNEQMMQSKADNLVVYSLRLSGDGAIRTATARRVVCTPPKLWCCCYRKKEIAYKSDRQVNTRKYIKLPVIVVYSLLRSLLVAHVTVRNDNLVHCSDLVVSKILGNSSTKRLILMKDPNYRLFPKLQRFFICHLCRIEVILPHVSEQI